jgi:hypothetical protein
MSIRLMTYIWDSGPENQSERFVLLALADFANDEGICWPSIPTVANRTCLHARSVRRIIRRLEAAGWISIEPRDSGSYIFRIATEKADDLPAPEADQGRRPPDTKSPPGKAPPDRESPPGKIPPDRESGTPDRESAPPGHRVPLTVIEPSLIPVSVEELLTQAVTGETAQSFIVYRKKHKARAMTVTGAKRLLKHLLVIADRGGDPNDALAMAEERGWASIEPDWYFNAKGRHAARQEGYSDGIRDAIGIAGRYRRPS